MDHTNTLFTRAHAVLMLTFAATCTLAYASGPPHNPLGLALAPNRHLIAATGDDGNPVEIKPLTRKQVAVKLVDDTEGPLPGAGALFGVIPSEHGVYFADDASSTFNLLH